MTQTRVAELFRYPIKGLSAQQDENLDVTARDGLSNDRRYALALGTTLFDALHPEPLEKGFFLMLRRNGSLAALKSHFDIASGALTVVEPGGKVFTANIEEPAGREAIEHYFAAYLGEACAGTPRVVEADRHKFTDVSVISPAMMRAVSVINPASVRDLASRCGRTLDPLRFRANIHVEGLAPWAELDWVGREITIGSVHFRCVMRTRRCAAIDVDPRTGIRDTALPKLLVSSYGHPDCGVYLEVLSDGRMQVGDPIVCSPPATDNQPGA